MSKFVFALMSLSLLGLSSNCFADQVKMIDPNEVLSITARPSGFMWSAGKLEIKTSNPELGTLIRETGHSGVYANMAQQRIRYIFEEAKLRGRYVEFDQDRFNHEGLYKIAETFVMSTVRLDDKIKGSPAALVKDLSALQKQIKTLEAKTKILESRLATLSKKTTPAEPLTLSEAILHLPVSHAAQ